MYYIFSIEGNIGSGKSTLVKILTRTFKMLGNIPIIYLPEPVSIWESITDKNGKNIIEKYYENQEKYAFFGQATYAATDRLDLTVGLRYSNEKRSINEQWTSGGAVLGFFGPCLEQPDFLCINENSERFDSLTPKFVVDYDLTDELMIYASAGPRASNPHAVLFVFLRARSSNLKPARRARAARNSDCSKNYEFCPRAALPKALDLSEAATSE